MEDYTIKYNVVFEEPLDDFTVETMKRDLEYTDYYVRWFAVKALDKIDRNMVFRIVAALGKLSGVTPSDFNKNIAFLKTWLPKTWFVKYNINQERAEIEINNFFIYLANNIPYLKKKLGRLDNVVEKAVAHYSKKYKIEKVRSNEA